MLTPLDFYYLQKELKVIEKSTLKRIYKSENFVFEFKPKKERFYLVVGKNFCYLDSERIEEKETTGFVNFLSSKLKNKKLLKIEQNDFNKVLVLQFSDFDLILEFIGKGNIILVDKENKIIASFIQREFKDRKIIIGGKYKFPSSVEVKENLKIEDLNKLHLGKIYKEEILKGKDVLNQKISPRIYFKDGEKFFVSPIELETLKLNFEKKRSFSEAIKEFFSGKKKTKEEIIRENQKKNLERYLKDEREFKKMADLILKYKDEIERSIDIFRKDKRIEKPIETEKKGIIILKLEGEEIELNINTELKDEINKLYDKSKKAREKAKKIEKLLLEKVEKNKVEKLEKKRREWYEQFRHFFTSDNFLVVAGKDADTNEKLIKKYCKKNDIVLHAHIPGSPFGIIRSEGKKITEQAIKEGAQFVGCYSRFWISKLGIAEVYWVRPEQVLKRGCSKKGSFMIYGKRNFLRVELKLVIGVNEKFEPIVCPANSLKKPKNFVVVVPGEKKGRELAENIKARIISKSKKEDIKKIEKINIDEFLRIVPYGKGDIV